jgi:small subunit ribosomal protein S16
MVVRIRLARFGKKRQPFYNIVVSNARYVGRLIWVVIIDADKFFPYRTARNSKPLEVLGTFNPKPQAPTDGEGRPYKHIQLDLSRAKYWLGVGAQPSDPAWKLLSMVRFTTCGSIANCDAPVLKKMLTIC